MTATGIQLPQDDLITEQQFADLVSRTLRTVRRWAAERTGPRRTRIGRTVYYSRAPSSSLLTDMRRQNEPKTSTLAGGNGAS